MKYVSTRGEAPTLSFSEVVLTGLASDGGLYVPESLPHFSEAEIRSWSGLSYAELALRIIAPFVGDDIPDAELKRLIDASYGNFRHKAIAPLLQLDKNLWVLELFQGPTLAFKDFALQFLGRLLDYLLQQRSQKVVILGATSGDTGSAAIEGCRHCEHVDIFILHPHQRVSEVQRRQMTTVQANNVHNLALRGNFDDCQNMVKAAFADQSFLPAERQLVAINSINWARIMAQIVYYFYSALSLGGPQRSLAYAVPTGNFGDIFAGYLAKQMGLPIHQLVVATNSNDILHRCLSENDHSKKSLQHSLSPSMDIMVSSNFERLLFDVYSRDGSVIQQMMAQFNQQGSMTLTGEALEKIRRLFSSCRLDDNQTLEVIRGVYQDCNYLLDPHTAIGVQAAREQGRDFALPVVCLATAHPAKFPEAIAKAVPGLPAMLPPHMQDLFRREERYEVLENRLTSLQAFIQSKI